MSTNAPPSASRQSGPSAPDSDHPPSHTRPTSSIASCSACWVRNGRAEASQRAQEDFDEFPLQLAAENLTLRPLFRAFTKWWPSSKVPPPTFFARYPTAHAVGYTNVFADLCARRCDAGDLTDRAVLWRPGPRGRFHCPRNIESRVALHRPPLIPARRGDRVTRPSVRKRIVQRTPARSVAGRPSPHVTFAGKRQGTFGAIWPDRPMCDWACRPQLSGGDVPKTRSSVVSLDASCRHRRMDPRIRIGISTRYSRSSAAGSSRSWTARVPISS
jgi:hypothetical protein